MKKLLFIFAIMSIISCTNNDDLMEVNANLINTQTEQDKLANFICDIGNLNRRYLMNVPTYKKQNNKGGQVVSSATKAILIAAADEIGAKGGTIVGSVGGPLGSAAGGFLAGIIASKLYKDYLDRIERNINEHNTNPKNNGKGTGRKTPPFSLAFSNNLNPTVLDSIGYIHNQIMSDIEFADSLYRNEDGSINKEELYNVCVNYLLIRGYNYSDFTNQDSFKEFVISLANESAVSCIACYNQEITFSEAIESVENLMINKYGAQQNCLLSLQPIETTIMNFLSSCDDSNILSYAHELNTLINNSSFSNNMKQLIRISADMLINSALYWNDQHGNSVP